jgi:hypothetical protein
VQALRLQPETKAIPLLKLLLVLPHGPQEGAQAAEDGTLEPWINRRRGGTALESSLNISDEKISDVTFL